MSKRRRGNRGGAIVVTGGRKRPIDKKIIGVDQLVTTSQTSTLLYTCSFAATITGIRWVFSMQRRTTSLSRGFWAIVLVRDGQTPSTLAFSDTGTLYAPEQNVLAWGQMCVAPSNSTGGPVIEHDRGDTKAMRKVMGGDKLYCVAIGSVVDGIDFEGAVQFFLKGSG